MYLVIFVLYMYKGPAGLTDYHSVALHWLKESLSPAEVSLTKERKQILGVIFNDPALTIILFARLLLFWFI